MGLIKRNGVFYIRYQEENKIVSFSLKTRSPSLAQGLYELYLKNQFDSRLIHSPRQETSNQTVVSYPLAITNQATSPLTKEVLPSINQAFEDYIRVCADKKITKRSLGLKRLFKSKFDQTSINHFGMINQVGFNQFKAVIEQFSPIQQKTLIVELKAFLNWSIKKGYYTRTEYDKIDFPTIKKGQRELVISKEDMIKILDHTQKNPDFYYYLKTLFYTASRPSEIHKLTIDKIDFTTHEATIYQHKVNKNKKVILPEHFLKELGGYIKATGTNKYLFNGHTNQRRYSNLFSSLKKELKLNTKYDLYSFRHSSITLLEKLYGYFFAQTIAGHSTKSAGMTANYIHINVIDFKKKNEVFNIIE